METVFFYIFAAVAIVAGLSVVIFRNPIHSALSMVVCFFALAGIYVLLSAHLVAILQILVYAGAIMVLVLFVIMLTNLKDRQLGLLKFTWTKVFGFVLSGLLLVEGIHLVTRAKSAPAAGIPPDFGTVEAVGDKLFSTYLLPFEMISLLLLVAMVGAVALTRKKIKE